MSDVFKGILFFCGGALVGALPWLVIIGILTLAENWGKLTRPRWKVVCESDVWDFQDWQRTEYILKSSARHMAHKAYVQNYARVRRGEAKIKLVKLS
jgi:hypothetical protein